MIDSSPRYLALLFALCLLSTLACGGGSGGGAPADPNAPTSYEVTAEVLDRGQVVYTQNCVPCHGPSGKGDGPASKTLNPKPRDHSNGEYMDALTDQKISETIRMGGIISGYPNMPSSPHIKGDDMVALVAFLRTLSHDPAEVTVVELKLQ